METDSLISHLEACGWFVAMPPSESAALKAKLAEHPSDPPHLALASLVIDASDRFGVDSLMKADSASAISTYEELFKAYARVAGEHFAPKAIVEEADDDGAFFTIGVLTKGRIHALFVPGAARFDIEINDLVNDIIAESASERRFFILPTVDETVAIAYVTPSAYERACRLGAIPLDEELINTELTDDALGVAESARPESYALRCDYDLVTH